ncbi:DedA family protein [Patescibacteria group bacterium]|nr:DedA family protein [Patescibacteria group bacterium]MDE1946957.1 DedA family protein [Patescibacteria group bacterium]MDE2011230.1 DedA family protein [Patescibacteria group bacterium]MDE2233394.1 DedA family protein [Patescibacteria group bacterium]
MDYLLSSLLSYLLLYKYLAVSVIVFFSGLLLPLPSNTLLFAAGAFASQGYLSFVAVFMSALISNVIGDSLGYALTRFWGTRFITEERLNRFKPVAKVEQFVRKHAGLAIFITRFLGTPGVIVNFLCGLIGVSFRRFVLYDIVGNMLDIGGFLVIGYVVGVYSENFSDIAQLVGWIVLILILIFMIARLFLKGNITAR